MSVPSDHKHDSDSVDKDFAPPEKKLKLDNDLGDNTLTPVPMSCDDPKVANNDLALKPNQNLYSEEEATQHFHSWCKDCNISYSDQRYRFGVFKETLEWIARQNQIDHMYAINQWADQTDDEIRSVLFCNECDSDSDTEQDHTQQPKPDATQEDEDEDDFDYEDAFG